MLFSSSRKAFMTWIRENRMKQFFFCPRSVLLLNPVWIGTEILNSFLVFTIKKHAVIQSLYCLSNPGTILEKRFRCPSPQNAIMIFNGQVYVWILRYSVVTVTQSVLKASNSFVWIVKFIILSFVVVRNSDGDTDQARKQRMQGNVQKAWLKKKRDENSLFVAWSDEKYWNSSWMLSNSITGCSSTICHVASRN